MIAGDWASLVRNGDSSGVQTVPRCTVIVPILLYATLLTPVTSKTLADTPDEESTPVDWSSSRPPLDQCDEAAFMDDLCSFLEHTSGKKIDRSRFPDVLLNKTKLDLFGLYKQVSIVPCQVQTPQCGWHR